MSTPHIEAPAGAFADTALLPGDPLRAKYIAERFLEGAVQVTAVRNMYGYTGNYRGQRVSVMGGGSSKFHGTSGVTVLGRCFAARTWPQAWHSSQARPPACGRRI